MKRNHFKKFYNYLYILRIFQIAYWRNRIFEYVLYINLYFLSLPIYLFMEHDETSEFLILHFKYNNSTNTNSEPSIEKVKIKYSLE